MDARKAQDGPKDQRVKDDRNNRRNRALNGEESGPVSSGWWFWLLSFMHLLIVGFVKVSATPNRGPMAKAGEAVAAAEVDLVENGEVNGARGEVSRAEEALLVANETMTGSLAMIARESSQSFKVLWSKLHLFFMIF